MKRYAVSPHWKPPWSAWYSILGQRTGMSHWNSP
jgi:hypothetical protein